MSQYSDFIPENIAPVGARRIGVYDSNGNRVGQIPLGTLTPPNTAKKLYSFGALSDIHIGESTANDDYTKALEWLSQNVDFICECGDLVHGGSDKSATQIEEYKACRASATVPVYAISGNHDGAYVANIETVIGTYSGNPLYYTVNRGNDVFIFVGNVSSTTEQLFTRAELQWLYETLEANRNKRCFLFQHVRPDDACGNALGVYVYDVWGGTEQTVFESLLRHYSNVVFFHGHSHLKFHMQEYSDLANYDKKFGCHSVHIPSISVPRDTKSLVNPSITSIYADSEGYVVDVYENGIHLRGRDFAYNNYEGRWLPIASYWLDTTLQTIPEGTYVDPTGTIKTGKYINWVPLSTEADGKTIFNGGLGYKNHYRVRSGGAESENDYSTCTGYIPVDGGDIISVYGWDRATQSTYDTINAYDSSFTNLGQLGYGNYGIFASGGTAVAYNDSTLVTDANGISSWVVPKASIGVAYIRVTATNFNNAAPGSNLIVTKNEEITL